MTYIPEIGQYSIGPDKYVDDVRGLKKALKYPGHRKLERSSSSGGWIEYAKKIEQAGADALELNLYYLATDPKLTGAELENRYINLVAGYPKPGEYSLGGQDQPIYHRFPNFANRLA